MFEEFAFCECNHKRIHRKRTGLLGGIAERIPRIIDSAKRCDLFDSNIFTHDKPGQTSPSTSSWREHNTIMMGHDGKRDVFVHAGECNCVSSYFQLKLSLSHTHTHNTPSWHQTLLPQLKGSLQWSLLNIHYVPPRRQPQVATPTLLFQ